jgi:hypothetical protein
VAGKAGIRALFRTASLRLRRANVRLPRVGAARRLGNALFGAWWADPVVALFIAYVAVYEGREAWRGDACYAH